MWRKDSVIKNSILKKQPRSFDLPSKQDWKRRNKQNEKQFRRNIWKCHRSSRGLHKPRNACEWDKTRVAEESGRHGWCVRWGWLRRYWWECDPCLFLIQTIWQHWQSSFKFTDKIQLVTELTKLLKSGHLETIGRQDHLQYGECSCGRPVERPRLHASQA